MAKQSNLKGRPVYIVDGSRTPFIKARGKVGPFTAADLAVNCARVLLNRQLFAATDLDEVITGCVMPAADEANISRVISLRLGCGKQVPAYTVQRNCASGMQALDSAAKDIVTGRAELVLAGGTEAMSHAPLLFGRQMANWLSAWMGAHSVWQRMGVLTQLRPNLFVPIIALLQGLTDPVVGLSMGQTAENLAYRFNISREQMDEFAFVSHQRLAKALDEGWLQEVTPLYDNTGKVYAEDDGLRRDSSVEKLAKLQPFFDKKFGKVTAGNSSQVTDGAAYLILASEIAIEKYQLPIRARIVDVEWAAVDPAQMGLGPVHAVAPILQRQKLAMTDVDYWEINEAFAAQVLACVAAWADATYCRSELGLTDAIGKLDLERLNIDGGATAIGHPVGASGARIVLHLLNILERKDAKRGIASICIGGGQGGALLLERGE